MLARMTPMKTVKIHAAKTTLSKLIERATAGEDIVIARDTTPVVRLVPVGRARPERRFGAMKGRARVTAAFFQPLPASELDQWE
jgi:prevent-host-death family protein